MSSRFDILPTPIAGLRVLQRKPIGDSRGYLERLFCSEELHTLIPGRRIAQINHTLTARQGTVRGMHFQWPPHAETKFVSCLHGEVFDVAVDVRAGSPTFLRWHSELLSADNHRTLVIPEGFAHGFQTLGDGCELLYLHTAAHRFEAEAGLNALDPRIAITWPLDVLARSDRDRSFPFITPEFTGISEV